MLFIYKAFKYKIFETCLDNFYRLRFNYLNNRVEFFFLMSLFYTFIDFI